MLFTYSLGGKTYDGSYSSLMGVSESGAAGSAYHKDIFNSWNGAPAGDHERDALALRWSLSGSERCL